MSKNSHAKSKAGLASSSPPKESHHVEFDVESNRNLCGPMEEIYNKTDPVDRVEEEEVDDEDDDDLLHSAICDSGELANGIVAVELWVFHQGRRRLERPHGGWWHSPFYQVTDSTKEALARLTDETREDYVPPMPLAPGVGLAGALWAEASPTVFQRAPLSQGSTRWKKQMSFSTMLSPSSTSPPPPSSSSPGFSSFHLDAEDKRSVTWREVHSITCDPDQPMNPRLHALRDAGFGLAAGVPFHVRGKRGIIVYMASLLARSNLLHSSANERYLCAAADVIGAVYALRSARRAKRLENKQELKCKWRRARVKLMSVIWMRTYKRDNFRANDMDEGTTRHHHHGKHSVLNSISRIYSMFSWKKSNKKEQKSAFTTSWWTKCLGAHVTPPPPMTPEQVTWTFIGVFVTQMLLSLIGEVIRRRSGDEFMIVIGPLGAFSTLLFGLTAAPASQPRNAILGQIVGTVVGTCVGLYFTMIPNWFKVVVAPSFAIPLMAALGILHPPAGASSVIFASGLFSWIDVLILLLGVFVALAVATIINNLSDRRQYPNSWTMFGPWLIAVKKQKK